MRMPYFEREPLSPRLQALRDEIMALPDAERRKLARCLAGDLSRRNDARHQEAHEKAEKARNRKRPDSRQMSLEDAA